MTPELYSTTRGKKGTETVVPITNMWIKCTVEPEKEAADGSEALVTNHLRAFF
jgi:hypothetical protein